MKTKLFKNNNGFTMIELIISLVVLLFGIIGVYSAFSSINALNYSVSSRFTAAYLGQEGLEIVKNLRDNNFIINQSWSSGLTLCSTGCQADYKTGTAAQGSPNQLKPYNSSDFLRLDSDGLYSYDTGTNTIFQRAITITPLGIDTMKVNVQVFWNYSGQSFSFQTEEYLYNWY